MTNGKIVLGDYAKKVGVDFRFTTPLVKLVHENGKVTGAIAKGSDATSRSTPARAPWCARAYARNEDMLKHCSRRR